MKNLTNRKKQALQTRNIIYNKCIQMMSEKGYDNIVISDVCKELGISIGCFYHHFKSKADIIIEAYRIEDEKFMHYFEEHPLSGTTVDKILLVFSLKMKALKEHGVCMMTQLYKSQLTEASDFLFSNDRPMPTYLNKIILEGQAKGEISSDYESSFITKKLMVFSRGIAYDWCAHSGSYDIEDEVKILMKIFLKGFQA